MATSNWGGFQNLWGLLGSGQNDPQTHAIMGAAQGLLGSGGNFGAGLLGYSQGRAGFEEQRRLDELRKLQMEAAQREIERARQADAEAYAMKDALRSASMQRPAITQQMGADGLGEFGVQRPSLQQQYAAAGADLTQRGMAGPALKMIDAAQGMQPKQPELPEGMVMKNGRATWLPGFLEGRAAIAAAGRAPATPSFSQFVGENGNVWAFDQRTGSARDTGVKAQPKGSASAGDGRIGAAGLKIVDEAQQGLHAVNDSLRLANDAIAKIEKGEVKLGAIDNLYSRTSNFLGASTPNSRAYTDVQQTFEKLRNNYLLLAKGVQTEGDAIRAWNSEIGENAQNDNQLALQQLRKAMSLMESMAAMQKSRIRLAGGESYLDQSAPTVNQPTPAMPQPPVSGGKPWERNWGNR